MDVDSDSGGTSLNYGNCGHIARCLRNQEVAQLGNERITLALDSLMHGLVQEVSVCLQYRSEEHTWEGDVWGQASGVGSRWSMIPDI